MRASRPFTCLRCRYEPISLIHDSPRATLSLFRAMFSPFFLLEMWDLNLVYIHVWLSDGDLSESTYIRLSKYLL